MNASLVWLVGGAKGVIVFLLHEIFNHSPELRNWVSHTLAENFFVVDHEHIWQSLLES